MSQVFHPRANAFTRLLLIVGGALLALGVTAIVVMVRSNWDTEEQVHVEQPVPFSHEHHVSGLGIDCRYCHSSAQEASTAGMPSTHTCMSCHSQMWTQSEMLRPVRKSYRTGEPIQWNRVHDLPDYVYFSHEVHTNNGIGCESCHGRIEQMPLVRQDESLYMQWCLDCHRRPEKHLRPTEFIYAFGYADSLSQEAQLRIGRRLIEEYGIQKGRLSNCSICHR